MARASDRASPGGCTGRLDLLQEGKEREREREREKGKWVEEGGERERWGGRRGREKKRGKWGEDDGEREMGGRSGREIEIDRDTVREK